jgi:hypothetical protein
MDKIRGIWVKYSGSVCSVADPPDPGQKESGSGSTSKNLSILTQKIVSKLSKNKILDVHPGLGS